MDETLRKTLVGLIGSVAVEEGFNTTPIPGVACYKISEAPSRLPAVYEPCLCVIVQGRKEVMLGKERLSYGELEFLVASVHLPVLGTVVEGSEARPYFVIQMSIDVRLISDLLLRMPSAVTPKKTSNNGLFIGRVDRRMGDSLLRLLSLIDSREDIPALGESLVRELHYRLLCSEHGERIAQISLQGTPTQRVSAAIERLRRDYREAISVDALASLAGMSVSTFHAHFKAVTNMSPLQFQKSIRLVEARALMVTRQLDAASTACQVGYESPSQFSREYARMFGNPPARDVARIRL
ncbi:AraC family transcriptional regulator [Alcanivorax sp. 521-1]|uniref:AraC family transcriptional regulator n=1 Tax=Alloalcanivorax profundimaris TaxID=2735259 RepID=A0ABS0AU65_9GAMM|nr:AraC family transcriptional regulator [Alloalcanivorax profundimaris]MBF5057525.1 AraC family transcriptional regulator [Alloalcanivorax profundimaris]